MLMVDGNVNEGQPPLTKIIPFYSCQWQMYTAYTSSLSDDKHFIDMMGRWNEMETSARKFIELVTTNLSSFPRRIFKSMFTLINTTFPFYYVNLWVFFLLLHTFFCMWIFVEMASPWGYLMHAWVCVTPKKDKKDEKCSLVVQELLVHTQVAKNMIHSSCVLEGQMLFARPKQKCHWC